MIEIILSKGLNKRLTKSCYKLTIFNNYLTNFYLIFAVRSF